MYAYKYNFIMEHNKCIDMAYCSRACSSRRVLL